MTDFDRLLERSIYLQTIPELEELLVDVDQFRARIVAVIADFRTPPPPLGIHVTEKIDLNESLGP